MKTLWDTLLSKEHYSMHEDKWERDSVVGGLWAVCLCLLVVVAIAIWLSH
jgi:hypothetical protein